MKKGEIVAAAGGCDFAIKSDILSEDEFKKFEVLYEQDSDAIRSAIRMVSADVGKAISEAANAASNIIKTDGTINRIMKIIDDTGFHRTEFEHGDIVLAKTEDGKRYRRGKIVGFGLYNKILIATLFSHFIAKEVDVFLVKRKPKNATKN